MELQAYILTERKFLHELSNQIVIAQGMASMAKANLEKNSSIAEQDMVRIEKSLNALNKVISILQERKAFVVEQSE